MKKWLLMAFVGFLFGCDNITDNRLIGDYESEWDAQSSVVVAEDIAFADGNERYLLKIRMVGFNGEPMVRKILRLKTNRTGLMFDGCTESTSDGITYCLFRSTLVGPQNIQLALGGQVMQRNLSFKAPVTTDTKLEVSAANEIRNTTSGYQVKLGFGPNRQVKQNVSGYSVQLSSPIRVRTDIQVLEFKRGLTK